jgi:sugar phosphate permease
VSNGQAATGAAPATDHARHPYRWAVLAAGTGAQASFSAFLVALPVLAPELRTEYGLNLTEIGVVLSAQWVGATVTLLPWGLLADRIGERLVLTLGLASCALLLATIAFAPSFAMLVTLLALAGAAGASVNSASGRAVMQWFGADERGLALGVRQTAIPIGGVAAALVLPQLGVRDAFLFLAALSAAGALAGWVLIRERVREGLELEAVPWTLRDGRLWRLSFGTGLYLVAQVAITGFVVLFLHDERGLSEAAAAAVLAAVQVLAVGTRIGAGRWSDLLGTRLVPLRRIGVAIFATLALGAILVSAPLVVLVPVLVAAGGLSMAWNGLSLTAAAELAGEARSGAAIGFQQTALSLIGVATPVAFAAAVAATSWRAGFALAAVFPLLGLVALRPLDD